MAAPPFFPSEWVVQIKAMVDNDDENSGREADSSLRVATPLLEMKREAYIPQFLSIGPYYHSKLDKDIESSCAERKISTAERYKGKIAARLMRKRDKSFDCIVEVIEQKRPVIERFYHLSQIADHERSQNFNLMMAVDSSFLVHFLVGLAIGSSRSSSDDDMIKLGPLHVCIKCDIMKLQNQIPLDVVREVFMKMKLALDYQEKPLENMSAETSAYQKDFNEREKRSAETSAYQEEFNKLLEKTIWELCPFCAIDAMNEKAINAPHLLGCMHAFISPSLQMATKMDDRTSHKQSKRQWLMNLILELPVLVISFVVDYYLPNPSFERPYEIALNAEKLAKGGIESKPFSKRHNKIQFDKYSDTLYLPQIDVWEIYTDVFLRNMLSLEFNDTTRGNTVMQYVSLMDCLIQTPEDARVLRHRGVIDTYTLTDEEIAKMWNDLGQPFFTGHMGPKSGNLARRLFKGIQKKYWKTKINRMLSGLFVYVSDWKFLATVAALLAFAMTIIQTYCSLYSIYHA